MEKIVVTIADKQAVFRVGLCHALSQQPDFEVFGSAPNENLMTIIEANSPNVLLLDIDYPSLRGLSHTIWLDFSLRGSINAPPYKMAEIIYAPS